MGNALPAKPDKRAVADYDITGLVAPAQHNRNLAKPLSSVNRCTCIASATKLVKPLSSLNKCSCVYLSVKIVC